MRNNNIIFLKNIDNGHIHDKLYLYILDIILKANNGKHKILKQSKQL